MVAEYLLITRRRSFGPAVQLRETFTVTNDSVFVRLCGSWGSLDYRSSQTMVVD